jgi:hypothetical protein
MLVINILSAACGEKETIQHDTPNACGGEIHLPLYLEAVLISFGTTTEIETYFLVFKYVPFQHEYELKSPFCAVKAPLPR